MPGSIDGLKLAHAVRNRWPPIKIIIVSGHVELSQKDLPANTRFFKTCRTEKLLSELVSMVA